MLPIPNDLYDVLPDSLRDLVTTAEGRRLHDSIRLFSTSVLTDEVLDDFAGWLHNREDPYARSVKMLPGARAGKFRAVQHPYVIPEMLRTYLRHDALDGWVYSETVFGTFQPYRVDSITLAEGACIITATAVAPAGHTRQLQNFASLRLPVERRTGRPETILRDVGLRKETQDLRADYFRRAAETIGLIQSAGVGARCEVDGPELRRNVNELSFLAADEPPTVQVSRRQVILDTHKWETEDDRRDLAVAIVSPDDPRAAMPSAALLDNDEEKENAGAPLVCVAQVFDPKVDRYVVVDIDSITPHVYDENVREKIVLPQSHRDLIDILTGDLTQFTGDLISGKSAGNMILCKGRPGVGKTLTAEVYAESMRKALYPIDMSALTSTQGRTVGESIEKAFERAEHWDAVILLDEADVLLGRRGDNLERNRMTAEFLQVVEYADRLAFVTTNRPDDIDEAVISRCAAVIGYQAPTGQDAATAWRTMAALNDIEFTDTEICALVAAFPEITPRTMRQLLRLAAQVAHNKGLRVDPTLVTEYAIFQGVVPVLVKYEKQAVHAPDRPRADPDDVGGGVRPGGGDSEVGQ